MAYKHLKIEKDNHIAMVIFNRPDKLNTLNIELMAEIIKIVQGFNNDEQTRVVIFTGAGKNFSCGVDLADPELIDRISSGTKLMKSRFLKQGPKMIREIYEMSQITIAAVNGFALGGGACIAAACDFRIGSETCKIGYPEVSLGMNLSWKALPMCVNLIGPARAKRMIILAQKEDAKTLLDWGFLDEIVPLNNLIDAAKTMACQYAAKPPIAAQMVKQSINAVSSALDQAIMHMDTDQYQFTLDSNDFKEGVQAFFDKRTPEFKGD